MWNPDSGYITKTEVAYPPWRVSGSGSWQGAMFLLRLGINDLDDSCTYGSHGFKVRKVFSSKCLYYFFP